jgi:hypothetical protein
VRAERECALEVHLQISAGKFGLGECLLAASRSTFGAKGSSARVATVHEIPQHQSILNVYISEANFRTNMITKQRLNQLPDA